MVMGVATSAARLSASGNARAEAGRAKAGALRGWDGA